MSILDYIFIVSVMMFGVALGHSTFDDDTRMILKVSSILMLFLAAIKVGQHISEYVS